MIISDVVVGLQHGDEGKGKVTYDLLKNNPYNYSIRYNGGPNAGHTIYIDPNTKVVLHQIPIGILLEKPSIIGTGCVIDIDKLEQEIIYLENKGFKHVRENLLISHNAHIIQSVHIQIDKVKNSVGTTGCGIGPCYVDKYDRKGVRVLDKLELFKQLHLTVISVPEYFSLLNNYHYQILFEGAQGFSIDIDWGYYPYCTSSSCVSGAISNCGIPASTIRHVYGCCKLYDTYVGSKKFQPDNDPYLEQLGIIGKESGATTGRKRQCNWLNLVDLKKSIIVNGCTHIIFNKCDIFQQIKMNKLLNSSDESLSYTYEPKHLKSFEFKDFELFKKYIIGQLSNISLTNTFISFQFSSSPYKI